MASPPAASILLWLFFLPSPILPIGSHFPSIHLRIPSIHPLVPGISSPCSILGNLLPDLSPCDALAMPLAPCVGAMIFRSGKSSETLTKACCDGAALIAKGCGTRVGKLAVCGCLKNVFAQISIVTPQNLRDVLAECSGLSLPVPNSDSSCI